MLASCRICARRSVNVTSLAGAHISRMGAVVDSRNTDSPADCIGFTTDGGQSTERVVSSAEELISIVSQMELSFIENLGDHVTHFMGRLEGQEVRVSFDFFIERGSLTLLASSRNKET